jgi:hypothetical protein
MSESSTEKSKRKFISLLLEYHWDWQYTIFFDHYPEALNIIDNSLVIKDAIKRAHKDTAILYRLVAKSINPVFLSGTDANTLVPTPYFTFFTSKKIQFTPLQNLIFSHLERRGVYIFPEDEIKGVRIKSRKITYEKLHSYSSAVNRQQPHNLKKLLNKENVNRFGVLNRSKLMKRTDEISEEIIP